METNEEAKRIESSEELKIAWRYENLSMDASNSTRCGNTYDLSTPYTLTEEQKTKIAAWDGSQSTCTINSKQLKGIFHPLSPVALYFLSLFFFRAVLLF